jgi:hypothetical protein
MYYLGDYVIPSDVLSIRQGSPAFARVWLSCSVRPKGRHAKARQRCSSAKQSRPEYYDKPNYLERGVLRGYLSGNAISPCADGGR